MATLKEIQNCELEILKDVSNVCENNNIRYWLAAGTFLGAVRHNGFIPWDDDVDIYVDFFDLKKLKKACKKELPQKYFWQDCKTDRGTHHMFAKVRNSNTYMPESNEDNIHNQGIWLDIFPLIYRAKSEKNFRKQVKYISRYQYCLGNQINIKKTNYSSFLSKIFRIFREIIVYRFLASFYLFLILCLGSKKSGKWYALDVSFFEKCDEAMISRADRKSYSLEMFNSYKYYDFEQYRFRGVTDFDKYLTMLYGKDYMIPKKYNQHIQDYSNVIIEK